MRVRHYTLVASGLLFCALLINSTCGPGPRENGNCTSACTALGFEQCHEDGSFDPPIACGPDQTCDPEYGCVVCVPDGLYCGGQTANDVYRCNHEGTGGVIVESCPMGTVCSGGECKEPCDAADDTPSNLGCDFWAVDLDNEAIPSNDAARQQFSVVIANNNEFPVSVTVTKNAARVGEPVDQRGVVTATVAPRSVQRIDLPQREVDGAMGQNGTYMMNSGSGTFVSPHAYRIVTNGPVVVYQFNPIVQQFSNDASTLIPAHALGTDYMVMGFDTANPCGIDIPGAPVDKSVPDHGSVAIVAPFDDTHVVVNTTHGLLASGGDSGFAIPETPAGGTLEFTIGRYTVVNLETKQPTNATIGECMAAVAAGQTGDLTGSYIKADKPIVVFTASERGIGFGGADNVVADPQWDGKLCCTDHLEEQLLPVTALGKEFAIARSPIRSTNPSWTEPDIIRVLGSAPDTTVTTNLPPPYDHFTLGRGEKKTFAATTGFTISADKAIQVASYLVSQQFIPDGFIGDPSQLLHPAAEQHRKDYVFLVPDTFRLNYGVFAKPVAANITLDGIPLSSQEFSNCVHASIGLINGVMYEQVTCPLGEGRHQASSDLPFGLSVYGYYNVGSYAYIGGSDIKVINPIY